MISKLSLKYRIALVIFALEAVMMTIVLWQMLGLSFDSAARQSSLTHDMLVELVSELGHSALLTTEYADLQLYLEHVQKEPTVEEIYVTNLDGRIVSGIPAGSVGQSLPEMIDNDLHFWRIESISTAGGPMGKLVVKLSNELLANASNRIRNIGILIAVTGMIVIAVVGIATGFALTRRLDRIADAARRFSEGETDLQTGVHGQDELAALAHTIDTLIVDVTESQQRLLEQGEQIQLLLDSTAEAIYGIDIGGICTFANPACVQLMGYRDENELVGERIQELFQHSFADGSPYPQEQRPIYRSFSEPCEIHVDHEVFWRKDGTRIPVEYWAHPILRQGGVIGSVVTFFDITQRRETEAELEQHRKHLELLVDERTSELRRTNKELEAFAYSVSHDLRSPLRAVDGFCLALYEDYAEHLDEAAKDYIERSRAATQRMGHLIDGLLQLTRVARKELDKVSLDLSTLAESAVKRLRSQDPDRHVDVHIEQGLMDEADPRLMSIVLDNLLGNAWKYTGRSSRPRIEFGAIERAEGRVYFVRDNGSGFDMEYVDKLFGTFQRLHGDREFPGTGIGLATVKRVIEHHGGRIWGEGEVGKGASFYFTLGPRNKARKAV